MTAGPSAHQPHAGFVPVDACWVCGATGSRPVATAIFEHDVYAEQDPELSRYTGATVRVVRCEGCGFGQPEALPALDDYFGRMYDQRWSREWMETEYTLGYKDGIFAAALAGLEARVAPERRTLLDVGAHVGRLLHLAAGRGWRAEGVELNPSTAAYAARATGLPVHRLDARRLAEQGRRFGAVTLIDVLEHVPEPVRALEAIRTALEPGGWIAVKVPSGPAQLLKERVRGAIFPRYRPTVADNLVHVNHFGARSLRMALERAGFGEVHVGVAPPELPPPATARERAGLALRRGVYAVARRLPGAPRSPLALHLLAFARSER